MADRHSRKGRLAKVLGGRPRPRDEAPPPVEALVHARRHSGAPVGVAASVKPGRSRSIAHLASRLQPRACSRGQHPAVDAQRSHASRRERDHGAVRLLGRTMSCASVRDRARARLSGDGRRHPDRRRRAGARRERRHAAALGARRAHQLRAARQPPRARARGARPRPARARHEPALERTQPDGRRRRQRPARRHHGADRPRLRAVSDRLAHVARGGRRARPPARSDRDRRREVADGHHRTLLRGGRPRRPGRPATRPSPTAASSATGSCWRS